MTLYQNIPTSFTGYGSLLSSLGDTALSLLIATTLQQFNCRKQTNKKKHFGPICFISKRCQQGFIPCLYGRTPTLCFSMSEEASCRH